MRLLVAIALFVVANPYAVSQTVVTAQGQDSTGVRRIIKTDGNGYLNVPTCAGTVVNISTSTTTATGTVANTTTYMISVRGTGAMCIWGGTATTTTGFWAPVDSVQLQRSSGTSLSCITVAGTGNVFATPCT